MLLVIRLKQLLTMNACAIVLTLIGRLVFAPAMESDEWLALRLLFFALVILGVVSGAVVWLRQTAVAMAAERGEKAA